MLHLEGRSHLKREGRQPCGWTTPVCQLASDIMTDSRTPLRAQFLSARHGIPNGLAALLAPLVWEGRHD